MRIFYRHPINCYTFPIFNITPCIWYYTRTWNRSFFRDRAQTLKRGFRRERSKLRFLLISRRMLWLSSSVQTKLGVNLDFFAGTHWIAISIAMQCRSSRRLSSFPRAVWRISQVSDAGGAKYKVFQVDFLLLSAFASKSFTAASTSNALWNYPRAKRIRNKYLPVTIEWNILWQARGT